MEAGPEQPGECCRAVLVVDVVVRSFPAEQPYQVVQLIAHSGGADRSDLHQVHLDQIIENGLRLGQVHVQQCGQRPGGEVGAGQQREHPKRVLCRRGHLPVGECEAGPYGDVADGQLVELALLVGEGAGHVGQGPVRSCGQARAGYPHRERKATAGLHDGAGRAGLRVGPLRAQHLAQQGEPGRGVQHVQEEPAAAQLRQRRAAGDDGGAPRAARQQVAHLLGVGRVVQDDEYLPPCQQGPVEMDAAGQFRGHRPAADAERAEEGAQDRERIGRLVAEAA